MNSNYLKITFLAGMLSATLVAYQNCARAQFTSDSATSILKLEGDAGIDPAATDNQTGIDPSVGDQAGVLPTPSPSPAIVPPVVVSPTPTATQPGKAPGVANGDGDKNTVKEGMACDDHGEANVNDLVECEMVSPNSKVILAKVDTLGEGSNAQVSRVCMSEYACLKIINDYAAGRSCKMSLGKAASDSQTQCSKIFPGSKGTCKNAKRLSDVQIKAMLEVMAK